MSQVEVEEKDEELRMWDAEPVSAAITKCTVCEFLEFSVSHCMSIWSLFFVYGIYLYAYIKGWDHGGNLHVGVLNLQISAVHFTSCDNHPEEREHLRSSIPYFRILGVMRVSML